MSKIRKKVSIFFSPLVEKAKRITIPGFDKIPIYNVCEFFFKAITRGAITTRASAIAYSFFLSLFPALIFFFTLIPFVSSIDMQMELMLMIKKLLPVNAYETVRTTVEDIITKQRGSLLSVGFFAAFYFATNGINSMIEAFNASMHSTDSRSWISQRLVSFLLALIITVLISIAVILLVSSETVLNYLVDHNILKINFTYYLLIAGKWIIVTSLYFFAISFLFYFAPSKHEKWRFISAGSTLATFLSIVTSLGFSFYINNFGTYNKLYGSIGTILVILVWLYFNALVLLVGFELNTSIRQAGKQIIRPEKILENN